MIFRRSLARRLLAQLALAMFVIGGIGLYTILDYADAEVEEVLDARLLLTGKHLMQQLKPLVRKRQLNEAWLAIETVRGLENTWITQFSSTDSLLAFKLNLGKEDTSERQDTPAMYIWLLDKDKQPWLGEPMPNVPGSHEADKFHTIRIGPHEWRILKLSDPEGDFCLYIAQRDDVRKYLSAEVGGKLLERQLLILPLLVFLLWLGIRSGLRPLHALSRQIRSRRPTDLQPVSAREVPEEILPLVEAINHLMQRVEISLENERSFTADAAHELRSPLAALRNLSQIIHNSQSLEEIQAASRMLERSTRRMSSLLNQLLNLARLDHLEHRGMVVMVQLRELLEELAAESVPVAHAKGLELHFDIELEAVLIGRREMLVLLFGNLLSNAVKYGSKQAWVKVVACGGDLCVVFENDGAQVSFEQLPHLFDRFYRTQNAREQAVGSGLGLSIVKRVAELHGFGIRAENRKQGGMRFTVRIPPARWQHAKKEIPAS